MIEFLVEDIEGTNWGETVSRIKKKIWSKE